MSDERALVKRLAAGPVSGACLARDTGLTRAAIWKRIEALREAGLPIQAQAGTGYHLLSAPDWLDGQRIQAALSPLARAELNQLEVAWSVDSTNAELLRCNTPGRGVAVLTAEVQTGGRGRRGREWCSPLGANIYLSLARYFEGGLARLGGLSLVAGIAAAEALQMAGFPQIRLKWPNDLVVEDEDGGLLKVGGLLVEGGGEYAGPARAVLGIGINVNMPSALPRLIDQPWTDLQALAGAALDRNQLVSVLLDALLPALARFDEDGLTPFLPRWEPLDVLRGREIDIHDERGVHPAIARGISEDGALRAQQDADLKHVHAGEVRIRAR